MGRLVNADLAPDFPGVLFRVLVFLNICSNRKSDSIHAASGSYPNICLAPRVSLTPPPAPPHQTTNHLGLLPTVRVASAAPQGGFRPLQRLL